MLGTPLTDRPFLSDVALDQVPAGCLLLSPDRHQWLHTHTCRTQAKPQCQREAKLVTRDAEGQATGFFCEKHAPEDAVPFENVKSDVH